MDIKEIAPGLGWGVVAGIANVYFVGEPGKPWFLVDTGVSGKTDAIGRAAENRYGVGVAPRSIVLTHGHGDHSGSGKALAQRWQVPIYVHPLELPYLTDRSPYPPKDPTVGGPMALLTRFLNLKPVDLRPHVKPLPPDGEVPEFPGWRWFITPGHAPGHVAFWHEENRILLAGDALTTVDLDSYPAMLTMRQQIANPPSPMTYDWALARESAALLADLEPLTLACGHGVPMSGVNIPADVKRFVEDFTPPSHGRYVPEPALTDERGVRFVPPPAPDPLPKVAGGVAAAILVAAAIRFAQRSKRRLGA